MRSENREQLLIGEWTADGKQRTADHKPVVALIVRSRVQIGDGRLRKRDRELLDGAVRSDDGRAVAVAVAEIVIDADIVLRIGDQGIDAAGVVEKPQSFAGGRRIDAIATVEGERRRCDVLVRQARDVEGKPVVIDRAAEIARADVDIGDSSGEAAVRVPAAVEILDRGGV